MGDLTGTPPNPECLHCVLPAVIEEHRRKYPHKPSHVALGELAQVLGEFAASGLYNAQTTSPAAIDSTIAFCVKHMRIAVHDLLRAVMAKGSP